MSYFNLELLVEKVENEYNDYINRLKDEPFDEIINSSYKTAAFSEMKDWFYEFCDSQNLNDEQLERAKKMLNTENLLERLFDESNNALFDGFIRSKIDCYPFKDFVEYAKHTYKENSNCMGDICRSLDFILTINEIKLLLHWAGEEDVIDEFLEDVKRKEIIRTISLNNNDAEPFEFFVDDFGERVKLSADDETRLEIYRKLSSILENNADEFSLSELSELCCAGYPAKVLYAFWVNDGSKELTVIDVIKTIKKGIRGDLSPLIKNNKEENICS